MERHWGDVRRYRRPRAHPDVVWSVVSTVAQPFGLFLVLLGMAIIGGTPHLWIGGCVFAIGAALIAVCRN